MNDRSTIPIAFPAHHVQSRSQMPTNQHHIRPELPAMAHLLITSLLGWCAAGNAFTSVIGGSADPSSIPALHEDVNYLKFVRCEHLSLFCNDFRRLESKQALLACNAAGDGCQRAVQTSPASSLHPSTYLCIRSSTASQRLYDSQHEKCYRHNHPGSSGRKGTPSHFRKN